jgi:hypothetical protein
MDVRALAGDRCAAEPGAPFTGITGVRIARPVLAAVVLATALAPSTASASGGACHSAVHHGVLPSWARTGFSDPRPRMPHVLGRSGDIAAIVFGYPLLSPPSQTRANKILWVSRRPVKPGSDLRIRAQRMRGDRHVGTHVVRVIRGGPGPSYLNLPAPGCWRLTLQWSARSDELDVDFLRRR